MSPAVTFSRSDLIDLVQQTSARPELVLCSDKNCSNTNNSAHCSREIWRDNFHRVYVAQRGFSIKVDQSNRRGVTLQRPATNFNTSCDWRTGWVRLSMLSGAGYFLVSVFHSLLINEQWFISDNDKLWESRLRLQTDCAQLVGLLTVQSSTDWGRKMASFDKSWMIPRSILIISNIDIISIDHNSFIEWNHPSGLFMWSRLEGEPKNTDLNPSSPVILYNESWWWDLQFLSPLACKLFICSSSF